MVPLESGKETRLSTCTVLSDGLTVMVRVVDGFSRTGFVLLIVFVLPGKVLGGVLVGAGDGRSSGRPDWGHKKA